MKISLGTMKCSALKELSSSRAAFDSSIVFMKSSLSRGTDVFTSTKM